MLAEVEKHGEFSVLSTGDGSPSLRGEGEPMHHLGGAYTETQYIYGEALRRLGANSEIQDWKVLVVGLGLGYIELLSLAEAIKHHKKLQLLSYEIKQELVDSFLSWLRGENHFNVYETLYAFFLRDYSDLATSPDLLKRTLLQMYEQGDWIIKKELSPSTIPSMQYHAILFDAFSGKSTPDLWTEEFLTQFLKQSCEKYCVFSTYACTGILKRTLHAAGFVVEKRPGFLGKRHSTLGIKTAL